MRNELIEATQRGDQERFEVALKSLQPENHALAVSLKQLSDDFRYDKILSLLIKKARA